MKSRASRRHRPAACRHRLGRGGAGHDGAPAAMVRARLVAHLVLELGLAQARAVCRRSGRRRGRRCRRAPGRPGCATDRSRSSRRPTERPSSSASSSSAAAVTSCASTARSRPRPAPAQWRSPRRSAACERAHLLLQRAGVARRRRSSLSPTVPTDRTLPREVGRAEPGRGRRSAGQQDPDDGSATCCAPSGHAFPALLGVMMSRLRA